jgi:hypothetical protein
VTKVPFHGGERDDQNLGDVAIPMPGRCELGDAALGRRQRPDAADQTPARSPARGAQLTDDLILQIFRAASVGQVDGEPQGLACLCLPAREPERDAEPGVCTSALEGVSSAVDCCYRVPEVRDLVVVMYCGFGLRRPREDRRSG